MYKELELKGCFCRVRDLQIGIIGYGVVGQANDINWANIEGGVS